MLTRLRHGDPLPLLKCKAGALDYADEVGD